MTNPDAVLVRASAEYMDDAAAFLLPRHQTYTAEQLTHLAARLRSLADRLEGAGPSRAALMELYEAARVNHLCHKQDEMRMCNYWSCKILARCEREARGKTDEG